MKNIHILSTDQPTGIFETNSGLQFSIMNKVRYGEFKGYHIYITSDEDIKKDEYYLGDDNHIYNLVTSVNNNGKKIILTTDPTLIADGVQSIDDDFLKWFVKNPSCEFVEVQKRYSEFTIEPLVGYKITIPQKEPKQYPMGGFAPGNYWHKECVTCKKEFMGDKRAVQCESCAIELTKQFTQKEPKQEKEEEYFKHLEKDKKEFAEEWEEIRQEFGFGKKDTLEEAAEKYANEWEEIHPTLDPEDMTPIEVSKIDFIAGAKWQAEQLYKDDAIQTLEKGLALLLKKQERMYSEEDLRQAFRDGQSNMHYSDIFGLDSSLTEQQWFENFKKK